MIKAKISIQTEKLVKEVIKGIQDKMGKEIACINLARISSTVCDYFVVCHGNSNTHVSAIAEGIEDQVIRETGLKPSRKEGFSNAEWILLDYLDVVVHVFQQEVREHFKIEDLWADAPVKIIEDDTTLGNNRFQQVQRR
jgi:ribosome-associated protein